MAKKSTSRGKVVVTTKSAKVVTSDHVELRALGCQKFRGVWSHPLHGDALAARALAGELSADERRILTAEAAAAGRQATQFDGLRRRARRTRNGG
jgi:hypothetical protein